MQAERSVDSDSQPGYDVCAGDEGIRAVYTSDDKRCHADDEVNALIEACHRLGADAMILETVDRAIVVAANVYDGKCFVAICDPEAGLPVIARGLQVRLYRQTCYPTPVALLPAATVRSALGRWERQIAVVFGRQYAARLVSGASGTDAPGRMTYEGLEEARRKLSSAIGGCVDFQKVDK